MKKNCQIWKAVDIASMLRVEKMLRMKVCTIHDNGYFTANLWNNDKRKFCDTITLSPRQIAEAVNMPLWEIVMVDNGGSDDYAILFYED